MRDHRPFSQTQKQIQKEAPSQKENFQKATVLFGRFIFAGALFLFFITLLQIFRIQQQPVRTIHIEGNQLLDRSTIVDFLDISDDSSYSSLDPYILSRRLRNLPWIREAYVQKVHPLDLKVSLQERVPTAYLRVQKSIYLIDQNQVVLSPIAVLAGLDLPIIYDQNISSLHVGERVNSPALERGLRLIKILDESSILPSESVSEIIITNPVNLQVVTIPDGIRIQFGIGQFQERLLNLYYAMPEIRKIRKKIQSLDLRYTRRVVVRKK